MRNKNRTKGPAINDMSMIGATPPAPDLTTEASGGRDKSIEGHNLSLGDLRGLVDRCAAMPNDARLHLADGLVRGPYDSNRKARLTVRAEDR